MLERMNVRIDGPRCWSGWRPAVHKPGPLIRSQTAFRKLRACDSSSRYWLVCLFRIYRGLTNVDLLTIRYRVPRNVVIFSTDSSLLMFGKILLCPGSAIYRPLSFDSILSFAIRMPELNNPTNELKKKERKLWSSVWNYMGFLIFCSSINTSDSDNNALSVFALWWGN